LAQQRRKSTQGDGSMTMTEDELIAVVRIDHQTLTVWVESGWLQPGITDRRRQFSDIDVARAQLIADLVGPMQVNTEGVDIILDLLDQMHGLRAAMRSLGRSIEAQPEDTRQRLRTDLRRVAGRVRSL
ncbi:MAG: chaperone modulator CbpM, partial [Devosia sp.]